MKERVFSKKAPVVEVSATDIARKAVERFDEERSVLTQMWASFQQTFPAAYEAYLEILRQQDRVEDLQKDAHSKVQAAKESVGDFKCVRKWKSEGYDPKEFTELLGSHETPGDVIEGMLKEGALDKVVPSQSAAEFFSRHPSLSKFFQPSWRDRSEMTSAVTDPKLPKGF